METKYYSDEEIKEIIRKRKKKKFNKRVIILALIFALSMASANALGKKIGNSKYEKDIATVDVISDENPLVRTAFSQIGNNDGKTFWKWYGFDYPVAWCACFISWCEQQNGYIKQELAPKFAITGDGIYWFKAKGQWKNKDNIPKAGDIIFFDWERDGICNHVGIVAGMYDDKVYTIEGNSSDMCRIKSYDIDSKVIIGYGYIDK